VTIFNGPPSHVLLVHFLVVLIPLTVLLEIVGAVWPAMRRGPILWLTFVLAIFTTVMTPITTHAGKWLYDLRRHPDPIVQEHAERGGWMIYFSVALLVVAIALGVLRVVERRSDQHRLPATIVVGRGSCSCHRRCVRDSTRPRR
jgi:uncharacterized membrane protein